MSGPEWALHTSASSVRLESLGESHTIELETLNSTSENIKTERSVADDASTVFDRHVHNLKYTTQGCLIERRRHPGSQDQNGS
ncbi:hypothetical protein EIP91_009781, partial [Steccherinum ochraceum]